MASDLRSGHDSIQLEPIESCFLCAAKGNPLYKPLPDHRHGVPGLWGLSHCPRCELAWLHPRPILDHIALVYVDAYGTHSPASVNRNNFLGRANSLWLGILSHYFGYRNTPAGPGNVGLGAVLGLVSAVRSIAEGKVMWLRGLPRGRLLDVGCGNGRFLASMRILGWQVEGVEPDPDAAYLAREALGLPVVEGRLEDTNYRDGSFDAVTASHVIEHVYNPVEFLSKCFRMLRQKGRLVVVTPNLTSLGHRLLHDRWVGLDRPRHLFHFSQKSLTTTARRAGLVHFSIRTTSINAWWWWCVSRIGRDVDVSAPSTRDVRLLAEGLAFQFVETLLRPIWRSSGEELLLIATKM